jgi:hypothetical protein
MKKFVKELQERGVFAKEVNCGNIAYHSRYISAAGPLLFKYLNEVECVFCYLHVLPDQFNCNHNKLGLKKRKIAAFMKLLSVITLVKVLTVYDFVVRSTSWKKN